MPVVTINGNDYDCYIDLADALIGWAAQPEAITILAMTPDQQGMYLVAMTRTIDRQVWQGAPTDEYQEPTAFPRTGLFFSDGVTPVPSDVVPMQVSEATAAGAALLANGSTLQDQPNTFNNTQKLKAGSVEIDYFRNIDPQPRFPQIIQELIGLWLGGAFTLQGSRASGTNGKTIFNELYDVNRGF